MACPKDDDTGDLDSLVLDYLAYKGASSSILKQLQHELDEPCSKRSKTSTPTTRSTKLEQVFQLAQRGVFHVTVCTMSAHEQSFDLKPWSTVADLMSAIEKNMRIPLWQQGLVLGARHLSVEDYQKELLKIGANPCNSLFVVARVERPRLLFCDNSGMLEIWDLIEGACLARYAGPVDPDAAPYWGVPVVHAADISREGKVMLCCHGEKRILSLWDIEYGTLVKSFTAHGCPVDGLIVDWTSMRVLISCSEPPLLKLWDLGMDACILSIKYPGEADRAEAFQSLAVDWPANRVLSGSTWCSLHLWDLLTGAHLRQYGEDVDIADSGGCAVVDLNWAKQRALSTADDMDSALKLWNLESGEGLHWFELDGEDFVCEVVVDWESMRSLSRSALGNLDLWDLNSGDRTLRISGASDILHRPRMDVDWTSLRALVVGPSIRLFDLQTGVSSTVSAACGLKGVGLVRLTTLQWPDT